MKKCIVVLEDNEDRRNAMKQWLDERLSMYELLLTDDPDEFIRYLRDRANDIIVVSLDHDLYDRADQSTTLTGMLVVDHLMGLQPTFPVLLHTSNNRDGERMQSRLVNRDWYVDWVTPFDGTSWVATAWYYALKKAIRKGARYGAPYATDAAD